MKLPSSSLRNQLTADLRNFSPSCPVVSQPVAPVVGHVAAAEVYGEGAWRSEPALTSVAAAVTRHGGADEQCRGRPVLLGDQRDVGGAAATEEDGVNGDTSGASQSGQMMGHCEAGR